MTAGRTIRKQKGLACPGNYKLQICITFFASQLTEEQVRNFFLFFVNAKKLASPTKVLASAARRKNYISFLIMSIFINIDISKPSLIKHFKKKI